jgi:DNA-binding SARP family transcriptional activator
MPVRLLGPVDVTVDGSARDISGARRKAVLAALALSCGEVLSTDQLLSIVWGPDSGTRRNTLQSHVSYLRRVLGSRDAILARAPGYQLPRTDDATDLIVAERLISQPGPEAGPAGRAAAFRAALALWRGQPLAGLADQSGFTEQARRLEQLRLTAVEGLALARLELGEHAGLLPELESLTREHPFEERLHGHLMLALYRSGRQHDALAGYQRLSQVLDEELGIRPSASLRNLHTAILRQDPGLDRPAPAAAAVVSPALSAGPAVMLAGPVPAQVPAPPRTFAGRAGELAALDGLMPADPGADPAAATACVVSGTAGVGKTTLAVYWAHQSAGRFPDGQLYVNLRGFDPSGPAVEPAEAVRGFLEAFGVPPGRVPGGLAAQAALYRSLLAGKRVLVLLDNARDAEQVRPLLPASPGCLTIVTSRNQLAGLVAAEGAYPLMLDLFTPAEAHDLLTRRLGADRVSGEPEATADIIAGCARLPLALVIAAARAATRPGFPLALLAAELRQASTALTALHGGDTATDLRAVLSWSHRTLSTDAAGLFRLLGLHPGPDISAPAAASLAGLAPGQATRLLAELADAHLLTQPAPGRYALHDLLRAYAAEHARDGETDDARREATRRMLDHYLCTAETAATALHSTRSLPLTPAPSPGVTREEITGYQQALAWFTVERPVLLAAVRRAADGFDRQCWQLASALTPFLDRQGLGHDLKAAHTTALAAARRQGDRAGQATALHGLGLAHADLRELDDARTYHLRSLDLFAGVGSLSGQAAAHVSAAWAAGAQGRYEEAVEHSRQGLRHYQAAGWPAGQAKALNNVGWYLAAQHEYGQALSYCQQALAIVRRLDDRNSQAHTSDSLGFIYHRLGRHQEAIECYQQARSLFRATGAPHNEATCLRYLGDVYDSVGQPDSARQARIGALDILTRLNHPDAGLIRAAIGPARTAGAPVAPDGAPPLTVAG